MMTFRAMSAYFFRYPHVRAKVRESSGMHPLVSYCYGMLVSARTVVLQRRDCQVTREIYGARVHVSNCTVELDC